MARKKVSKKENLSFILISDGDQEPRKETKLGFSPKTLGL